MTTALQQRRTLFQGGVFCFERLGLFTIRQCFGCPFCFEEGRAQRHRVGGLLLAVSADQTSHELVGLLIQGAVRIERIGAEVPKNACLSLAGGLLGSDLALGADHGLVRRSLGRSTSLLFVDGVERFGVVLLARPSTRRFELVVAHLVPRLRVGGRRSRGGTDPTTKLGDLFSKARALRLHLTLEVVLLANELVDASLGIDARIPGGVAAGRSTRFRLSRRGGRRSSRFCHELLLGLPVAGGR